MQYDDGSGHTLDVQLGTTACKQKRILLLQEMVLMRVVNAVISGQKAFELLPPDLKDLAFRTKVKYAPHPYLWISKARAHSTGLGMVSEGLELKPEELPDIDEDAIKVYPMVSELFVVV